jgi:tetratricopeptide (TPR) repeat protein
MAADAPATLAGGLSGHRPALTIWESAMTWRTEGNALFRADDMAGAVRAYKRAYLDLRGLEARGLTSSMIPGGGNNARDAVEGPSEAERKELAVAVHANLAAAYLKLSNAPAALRFADEALKLDSSHVKATHRRAQALLLTGRLPVAEEALQRTLALHGRDDDAFGTAVAAELRRVRADMAVKERRFERGFARAFARAAAADAEGADPAAAAAAAAAAVPSSQS